MSDDESRLIEVVVRSQKKLFGLSDFDAIESNEKIREYAAAIVSYAQRHGINVNVREGEQSTDTGRLSGVTLQASGMVGSIAYVAPDKQNKRATIKVELPLARASAGLQNFDQYCDGLASIVSKFK